MPQKLTSRKFWLAVIGAGVMMVNALTDLSLDTTQMASVLLPIIAYILGEAWVDSHK